MEERIFIKIAIRDDLRSLEIVHKLVNHYISGTSSYSQIYYWKSLANRFTDIALEIPSSFLTHQNSECACYMTILISSGHRWHSTIFGFDCVLCADRRFLIIGCPTGH
jgi:hypothetical protein